MKEASIILADDHQIILDGLCDMLHGAPGLQISGTASGGRAALSLVQEIRPDLLLMDLNMPDLDGFEVLKTVKTRFPSVKVLVLTMYDSPELMRRTFNAGADGYMLKDHGRDQLLHAIRRVLAGKKYVCEKIGIKQLVHAEKFPDHFQSKITLTDREIEILRLITQSLNNKEIAGKLFISEFTVKAHRRNLKRKLNADNTADLVKFAYNNGIA